MIAIKKTTSLLTGFLSGALNGMLGAGGGIVVAPCLINAGMDRKQAHANSICVMLPACLISSAIYLSSGSTSVGQALPFIPWGVLGAVLGAFALTKINREIIKKIFGCFCIWAAFRMLLK